MITQTIKLIQIINLFVPRGSPESYLLELRLVHSLA